MSPELLVVVLAAGASRRLGTAKQLFPIDGEPLLRRQCRCALDAHIGRALVMRVLRTGSAEWTCMPSRPGAPSPNPMCATGILVVPVAKQREERRTNPPEEQRRYQG